MNELLWKAIPGYSKFGISISGTVYFNKDWRKHKAGDMVPEITTLPGEEPSIAIFPDSKKDPNYRLAFQRIKKAKLLLLTYIGPKPHQLSVPCYKDFNPNNLELSNLYWDKKTNYIKLFIKNSAT